PAGGAGPPGQRPAVELRRRGREELERLRREWHRGGEREQDEGRQPGDAGRVRAGAAPSPLPCGGGEQAERNETRGPEEPRHLGGEERKPQRETLEGEQDPPIGRAFGGCAHARSPGPCGWR